VCCEFLWSLKIHCLQPGLNAWTLGPLASVFTTRPLRWPCYDLIVRHERHLPYS
jgi:hypothetical protein